MALFRRNAADIFAGKNDDTSMPEYRVAAWASYDLKEHMREKPFTINVPEDIMWTVVQVDDDLYEARGVLHLPIEMRLRLTEDGELVKDRVILNGEKRYDAREEKKVFDPLASVDVDAARVQAFTQYQRNLTAGK